MLFKLTEPRTTAASQKASLFSAEGGKPGLAASGLWTALSTACGVQREEKDSPRWLSGLGPQPEPTTEPSVSLPFACFLMEKEQLLPKIYLGLICKANCSLRKAAVPSAAWYLCEDRVLISFPHACGAVKLAAHKGRNFQADSCQGSLFNTPQDLLGQVALATTNSSILSEALGNTCFSRDKFRMPCMAQCWL